jgi:aspartate/methionine/tyrosine aminotransferase
MFSDEQLALLAEFCERYDATAICDEVWEHVIFDDRRFTSMLAVEGMRNRTIKIGSAGKIFSLTGWKVGLVAAAPPLMKVIAKAHQFLTFTTAPNLQIAVALGLAKERDYFIAMRAGFQRSRDRFVSELTGMGFNVMPSHGTYFVNVDLTSFGNVDDVSFADRLVREFGVASIPVSAFYAENHNRTTLRFCFAKKDSTLDEGLSRLRLAARAYGLRG